jgi:hypothetical protein
MDAAAVGRTQKEDRERGIDQQDIFHRVVLFLAAITLRLLSRVLEADDTPFGARRVKKPKPISFLAFLDPPTSAPGLDFPLVMPHTHLQRKPQEQRWNHMDWK